MGMTMCGYAYMQTCIMIMWTDVGWKHIIHTKILAKLFMWEIQKDITYIGL